jgi:hypothetical protein
MAAGKREEGRVPGGKPRETARIDELMDRASEHLAQRRYFDAERECLESLNRAFAILDYEHMARILLPLQESRRQKRDLAVDAGEVFRVNGELPSGKSLRAGCYLVEPPRVGIDGRLLREEADRRKVPAIIVVREPTTREGLWPIVALGPVTVRTRVHPPALGKPPTQGRRSKTDGAADAQPPDEPLPPPDWFLRASEALGDTAIAQVEPTSPIASRIQALLERMHAHPDHEKLHQLLADACREASRLVPAVPRPRRPKPVPAADPAELGEDVV